MQVLKVEIGGDAQSGLLRGSRPSVDFAQQVSREGKTPKRSKVKIQSLCDLLIFQGICATPGVGLESGLVTQHINIQKPMISKLFGMTS